MKKVLLVLILFGIGFAFAEETETETENYEELLVQVEKEYGEDRVGDFQNIWRYAEDKGIETLSWETVKRCLDTPCCLETGKNDETADL